MRNFFFTRWGICAVFSIIFLGFLGNACSQESLDRQSFYLISSRPATVETDVVRIHKTYGQGHRLDDCFSQPIDVTLTTSSGITFTARYFDNHQNRVIVLGQGFPREMDAMQEFIPLLGKGFDYVVFDYRWKDFFPYVLNPSTLYRPIQRIFYDEQEEILAVIRFLREKKHYYEIIGLGQCYSSFLFVVTQAEEQARGNQLFSRLILESCWYSLGEFALGAGRDPWLMANPQHGGPDWLRRLCSSQALHGVLGMLAQHVLPDISIKSHASKLKDTPILFVHGMNDKLISLESFSRIWNTVNVPKAVLLTPHHHVDSLQKDGIMAHASRTFLESRRLCEFTEKMKQ